MPNAIHDSDPACKEGPTELTGRFRLPLMACFSGGPRQGQDGPRVGARLLRFQRSNSKRPLRAKDNHGCGAPFVDGPGVIRAPGVG